LEKIILERHHRTATFLSRAEIWRRTPEQIIVNNDNGPMADRDKAWEDTMLECFVQECHQINEDVCTIPTNRRRIKSETPLLGLGRDCGDW